MLVVITLLMYMVTTAFAFMNVRMTLNIAFQSMKLVEMCGGSNVIDIGFINVQRHHYFCLNEYKENTKYRFLMYEFSVNV